MCGVAATFGLLGSLRGLIHPAVRFLARIKLCSVTPLQQVRMCLCARCEFRGQIIAACIHSVSQSVCGARMEWTQDKTLAFNQLYEKMCVLWDPKYSKHYNKLQEHYAWNYISGTISQIACLEIWKRCCRLVYE